MRSRISPLSMHVGLAYDLREEYLAAGYSDQETAEFDCTETIEAIENSLVRLGCRIDRIGNSAALIRLLQAGERWDMVFNICEGLFGFGRESLVPALLESYRIPYTFSDPLVCAVTLHKAMAKSVVRDQGIATPDFMVIERMQDLKRLDMPFPLFVKPVAEGTSKGIGTASVIRSLTALKQRCSALLQAYGQPVLVESFLPGREFTVGIVGTAQASRPVGTLEVLLCADADPQVYSYRNKEQCEELVEYRLLEESMLRERVEKLALASWRILGCRDAGRVDVRCDENGEPSFLEVNPLAGLHPKHSDLPIMCSLGGIKYQQLIEWIVESARARVPAHGGRSAAAVNSAA